MQKPWTILICCYNCTNALKNTINSIKFKNNDDIDVNLIGDGSKDNLYSVGKPYLKMNPKQLHYYKKRNGNQGSCINFALKQ